MSINTTKNSGAQARRIRHLPAYQLVKRYRRAGYTQAAIATAANTTQGTVTNAINRTKKGPAVERVWEVLERILG